MAAKKAAASSEPQAAAAEPVSDFPMREEPYLDPLLEKQREANRRDVDGVAEVARDEPSLDPALASQVKQASK